MNWRAWLRVLGIGGVIGLGIGGLADVRDVSAAGQELPGIYYRDLYGANYWDSSNIREWLNSDQANVGYTTQKPTFDKLNSFSYDTEAGFLSSANFTSSEKSSIAITNRRSFLSQSDFGVKLAGTGEVPYAYFMNESMNFSFPEITRNWKNYIYRGVKDRVFLLNPAEAHEYIQKRGYSMQKSPSDTVRSRYNISSEFYNWSMSGGFDNSNTEIGYRIMANGVFGRMLPKENIGIVPAMHVKPGARVNGTQLASGKAIGEIVTFGKYSGAPITWVVSNKLDDGTVLLISEKVISIKAFDAPGDAAQLESDYVTITEPEDVEIVTDLKYKATTVSTDVTLPTVRIVNKEDVTSRREGAYDVQISAFDAESGIKRIIMPDGTSVVGATATYRAEQNGMYVIGTEDNAGNYAYTTLNVGNISLPSSVVIKTSASGWTNKNVTVDISASNDVGWYEPLVTMNNANSTYGNTWSDYSSYAGKQIRFTGTVKMTQALIDPKNYRFILGIQYVMQYNSGDNSYITYSWPESSSIYFKDMNNVDVPFDFTYTVPTNFYGDLKPLFRTSVESWLTSNFKFEIRDVKVELLDKGDFGINKIVLPNGTEIKDSSYVDTLANEGSYEYKVVDNRGITTSKIVDVKIDKVVPSITVTGNPATWTKQDVVLNVTASDALSGVKRIQKPNGEWASGGALDYVVLQNGTYTFIAEDNAGNTRSITTTVTKIDKDKPLGSVSRSNTATWIDGGSDTLTFNASDALSGVKRVRNPDGVWATGSNISTTVTKNGSYEFLAEDNSGNVLSYVYEVTNFTLKPSLAATVNGAGYVDTSFGVTDTWQGYTYDVFRRKIGDASSVKLLSGVSSTIYADRAGTDVSAPSVPTVGSATVTTGGTRVNVDYASSIDAGTGYEYQVTAKGSKNGASTTSDMKRVDVLSGLSGYSIVLDQAASTVPDNTIETTSTTYEMTKGFAGGFYVHVKAIDRAGNGSVVSHYQVTDNVPPVLNVSASTSAWTSGNVVLSAVASDADTGVKRVKLPTGVWLDGSNGSYTATVNGTYVFEAEDMVGNTTTRSVVVTNIDKTLPTSANASHVTNWDNVKTTAVTVASGTDSQSGVWKSQYKLSGATVLGWTDYVSAFNVSNEGSTTVTVRTLDKVGNASAETSSIVKLDRTEPVITDMTLNGTAIGVMANDALSGLYGSPLKLSARTVGVDPEFVNGDTWVKSLSIPELRANAKYEYRALVRDNAGNVKTSETKTYMTKPVLTYGDVDKGIADNAVRFTLRDGVLPEGETTLEIYRSGNLYAMIKNGNQFVDRGVSYDKEYTYRLIAVTEVDGKRVASDGLDVVVKVGVESLNFDLDKRVYHTTMFNDDVTFTGTVRYRQGGDVELYLNGKKERDVSVHPFATTEWSLNKQNVLGNVTFKSRIDDNGIVYEVDREIRVEKKTLSRSVLSDANELLTNVYE